MAGKDLNLDNYHEQYKAPPFYKLRISLTGFSDSATRDNMVKIIQENGAEYSPDLDRTVSHLIAKHPSGKKFEGAPARGVLVVSEEWLYDSVKRGMILDEKFYDVRWDPEKRGIGAYDRNHVPVKFALGKRVRQQDAVVDPQGRRKLRRTLSQKLSQAHDAMWADIKAIPVQKPGIGEWQDNEANKAIEEAQEELVAALIEPPPLNVPQGAFSGITTYIHGFPKNQSDGIQKIVASRGGLVLESSQAVARHSDLESASVYLVTPHNVPDSKLLRIPAILNNVTRVTEWWIEVCCFNNVLVSPTQDRFGAPFFTGPLPGFSNLVIASTSFRDYDLIHISQTIRLLGATYDEWLKPSTSALICKPEPASVKKLEFTKEHNIPAVTIDWLWACIDAGQFVPFDDYQVGKSIEAHDVATYQTTDTMTLPSAVIGKNHNSRSNKSGESNESLPQENKLDLPSMTIESNTSPKRQPIEAPTTDTIMPLNELSTEMLNSPTRSPQRKIPVEFSKTVVESENVPNQSAPAAQGVRQTTTSSATSEILSMLVARSNARQPATAASDDGIQRRKRKGLGRAISLGITNDVAPASVEIEQAAQKDMVYTQVEYGDDEEKKRRKKLLAEIVADNDDEGIKEKVAAGGGQNEKQAKTPASAKKARTPAKKRKKRN